MSSELRLKKLRGSGGYIMANVTDEQQARGNLGGPELFLAPIGRLDPNRITRYYCNTCDIEYVKPPKIEYENPNEEVAENLMLVERGQYSCVECNSAIAEYREFKKPDEAAEIGAAKPLEPEPAATQTTLNAAEPAAAPEPEPAPAAAPEPEPAPEAVEPEAISPEPKQPQPESEEPSITMIQGMDVYDSNARKAGTVSQVGVDQDLSLMLVIKAEDGTESVVPWSRIKTIGQILLLEEEEPQGDDAPDPGQCPSCNCVNSAESKFCEQCGNDLGK